MKKTKYQKAIGIYNSFPATIKNLIVKTLRLINFKTEKYYADMHYTGVFTTKVEDSTSIKMISTNGTLENQVFWNGIRGYEPESMIPWMFLSKESNTIVDIGANVGIYSLLSASLNPSANIICFEPSDGIYAKMVKNFQLNNFTNIKANKVGISDQTGTLLFYDVPGDHLPSASFSPDKAKNFDSNIELIEHNVEVITLDEYIKQNNINKVDLLKIDVELFEKQVLDGALNCIKNHRPTIFFEVLTTEVANSLQPIFDTNNYKLLHLNIEANKPKLIPTKTLYVAENKLWNFLAIPSENTDILNRLNEYLNSL
jgi:FkbM family methyltransferase